MVIDRHILVGMPSVAFSDRGDFIISDMCLWNKLFSDIICQTLCITCVVYTRNDGGLDIYAGVGNALIEKHELQSSIFKCKM